MKEYILVSSCILGENTKYNGKNNYHPLIEEIKEKYNIVKVCPEEMGGLSTPRNPSEIIGDKVVSSTGVDVTNEFVSGANIAVELVKKYNIKLAIMKDGSPSCGSLKIYDGTFSGTKIDGMGIAIRMLKELGVKVYTEENFSELLRVD